MAQDLREDEGKHFAGEHLLAGGSVGVLALLGVGRADPGGKGSGQPAPSHAQDSQGASEMRFQPPLELFVSGTRCGICNSAEKGPHACPVDPKWFRSYFCQTQLSSLPALLAGSSRCCHLPI